MIGLGGGLRGYLRAFRKSLELRSSGITIGSPNPAAAHLFLNYLFRPEVNALLIETIWYPPVHTGVLELLPADFREKVAVPEGYLDKL